MTHFRVEVADIDSAVVRLNEMAVFCQDLLAQIDAIVATVSDDWSGEAFGQFQALHAEWAAGAQDMADGAKRMTDAATDSSLNYAAAAESNKAVWS